MNLECLFNLLSLVLPPCARRYGLESIQASPNIAINSIQATERNSGVNRQPAYYSPTENQGLFLNDLPLDILLLTFSYLTRKCQLAFSAANNYDCYAALNYFLNFNLLNYKRLYRRALNVRFNLLRFSLLQNLKLKLSDPFGFLKSNFDAEFALFLLESASPEQK